MSEIGGLTPPPGYTGPAHDPSDVEGNRLKMLAEMSKAQAKAGGTLSDAQILAVLEAMARMTTSLEAQGGAGGTGGIPGVTNGNGAPAIEGVQFDFSAEDMAMALQALQGKTQDAQLETAKKGLQMNEQKMAAQHAEALKKLDEMIKKSAEASQKDKAGDVLGWITKIAGFVGAALAVVVAAAATVATGGAAAPLLALAIVGMVGATISLASAISQELGGPPLEISSWLAKGCTAMFEAMGMPKDKAEAAGKMMSGAIGLVTGAVLVDPALAGNLVGGIVQMAGGDETAVAIAAGITTAVATIAISVTMIVLTAGAGLGPAIDGMAKTIQTAGKIAQAAVGIAAGATSVAAGGVRISQAVDEHEVGKMQSDKAKIDALILKLGKQMEEDREEIKKVLEQIQEGMTIVSQIIAAGAQSRSQLSQNLGRSQTI